MSSPQTAGLEAACVDLAVEAGRMIASGRPAQVSVSATKTSELDVVTAMDTAVEQLLRDRIAAEHPQDAILGEEGGASAGTSGLTWVLDPIDGTVNYLYGIGGYAVSVAVVTGDPTTPGRWQPVAGAVCSPGTGEVFHAQQGSGAWRRRLSVAVDGSLGELGEPAPIQVTAGVGLAQALVGTGFSYDREHRVLQGQVASRVLPQVRDLRRLGAAAMDLCAVAVGRLDAFYEQGLKPWDVAAGLLIVTEAGGRCGGPPGAPPGESLVLAAGADLFEEFAHLMEQVHAPSTTPN